MLEEKNKISNRLTKLRLHFGKSQNAMAEWVGISRGAWINYETGKSQPNSRVLAKLCKYGANSNWILTSQGNMINYLNFAPNEKSTENESALLTHAIEYVETWLEKSNISISARKKAKLLTLIYNETLEAGETQINNSRVNNLLKLVSGQ